MTQRYEVKGKIGHGGLGEVYLAYDTRLDREVALKRVKPQEEGEGGADSLAADLLREAKTLSALQHPNIVTIYDVGRDDKGPFVIMEFLKGETLDEVIERGKLSTEDFRQVVLQTMEGMVAAQALGLVHRDLKPGNLMVIQLPSGKFQIKILDFGLAKFSKLAVPQTQDQEAGIFGSIFFMAPEQFERLPLDPRTDMYSLGCIFYQILAQKHPFDGRTPVDVMVSHLQHLVTPLHELRRDIPAWMADWVMWLIGRDMDDRPADAATALEYFLAEKSGLPSAAAHPPPPPPPVVKVVGRGTGPGGQTQTVTTRARPGSRSQQIRPGGRGGSHSSAMSSRPGAIRVQKTDRLHWSSVLTGLVVVGICLWIFWKIYESGQKPKFNPRDVLTTLKGDAPEGNAESVRTLVIVAGMSEEDAKSALEILKKLKGSGVADTVGEELAKAEKGPVRNVLIEAAGAQPSTAGAAALLKIALEETGDVRTATLAALGASALPSSVPELMKQASKFNDENSRRSFFAAIGSILAREPNRDTRVKSLLPALKSADTEIRIAICRLLGTTGSTRANDVLSEEIAAGGDRRRTAIDALKSWSCADASLAHAVFTAAQSGDHDLLTGAYCRTVTRVSAFTGAEVVDGLKKALPLADTAKSKAEFAQALGSLGSAEALAYVNELEASPDVELSEALKPAQAAVKSHNALVRTLKSGENHLDSSEAVIVGSLSDAGYNKDMHYLSGWRSLHTRFAWDILVPEGMTMEVDVLQSSVVKDRSFFVSIGAASQETDVLVTRTTDAFMNVKAGKFTISKAGSWRVWIEAGRTTETEALMNIRKVTLKVE
jgi:serine/threonine protein kinase